MTPSFDLSQLLAKASMAGSAPAGVTVKGIRYNSKDVQPGDLFFAVKGHHADGHDYVEDAAKLGAVAAVVDRNVSAPIPTIQVPSVPPALSRLSNFFYGEPSRHIPVIGITGTNGKTTTTFLIENILRKNNVLCGILGTVHVRLGSDVSPAVNTTPVSADVQAFIAKARDKKAGAVAMEVSSHALELDRVNDVTFAAAVFTNLTQDHLDFHKTMENYFQAKRKLFVRKDPPKAVISIDDSYGERLLAELPDAISFGFSDKARLRAIDPKSDLNGIQFTIKFPSGKTARIKNNLMGRHNISNCLSAAGALVAIGRTEDSIVEGLNQPQGVPGRLERVEQGQKFVVVVDYAHTHDALAQVLTTLRNTGPRQLICVFGAGGDRDKTKRPKMGEVAARLSDRVFVTSDNPRSENPGSIMKDIEAGLKASGKKNYTMIEDRARAIGEAIGSAGEGDIILIAGKGHEDYQIIGNKKNHFSDVETARNILSQ